MYRIRGGGRDGEQRLVVLYQALSPADRSTLLAFGEFLAARDAKHTPKTPGLPEPVPIPRPQEESLVAAIKRLSRSYYMLDPGTMLNDTSTLMGAHILQGRPAAEVIDELETLFARCYTKYREQRAP